MIEKKDLLISYLSWILCFLICMAVGIYRTYALTFSNFQYVQNSTQLLVEYSSGAQPIDWPYNNSGLYQTDVVRLNYIVSNVSIFANVHYEFESHMLSQRIIGSPTYTVTGLNGESCLTDSYYLNFINSEYPRWDFQCPHATSTFTLTIYQPNSSNLFNSGTMGWGSAILSQADTQISSSGNDTEEIINNQNKNTNDIIDNQNKNTQDIINSNKTCNIYDANNIDLLGKYLNSNGTAVNTANYNYGISSYIKVNSTTEIKVLYNYTDGDYMCFYNVNKDLLSCLNQNDYPIDSTVPIPNNATYFRYTAKISSNRPQFKICENGNQAISDSLNDDDTSGATDKASDFFSSFNTNTFGLTSIITAPLTLIQSIASQSCTSLHLPLPYLNNKYLDLPCMSTIYSTYFGTFFTLYQTITYGIIAYWVCVRIFNQVKDFKNPEHDEIEVLDL